MHEDDLSRVSPPAVAPDRLDLPRSPQREGSPRWSMPPRLFAAIHRAILETRGFNERTQMIWCHVCRDKDPNRLHNPNCPIYELHSAWNELFEGGPTDD